MSDLYIELKKTIKSHEEKIKAIDKFMKNVPDGYIACEKYGNSVRYILNESKPGKGRVRKHIRKKEKKTIEDLAKKKYYKVVRPEIERELNSCQHLLKILESEGKEAAFSDMSVYRKDIVDPMFARAEDNELRWTREPFLPKEIAEGTNTIRTRRGEDVRSKSEKIIADELFMSGVPYKYECPLQLRGFDRPIYPDFTVLNKRTGKVYFWEHLGMIDEPNYYSGVQWRLDLYAQNGIYIGDRILLTYETNYRSLNTSVIEFYIKEYLS